MGTAIKFTLDGWNVNTTFHNESNEKHLTSYHYEGLESSSVEQHVNDTEHNINISNIGLIKGCEFTGGIGHIYLHIYI